MFVSSEELFRSPGKIRLSRRNVSVIERNVCIIRLCFGGTLSKIETMRDNKMNFIHQTIFIQIIAFDAAKRLLISLSKY